MDTVFAVYLFRIVCLSHVPVWQYAAPGHGTRLTGTAGHIVYISGHRVGSDIQRCCQFAKEQLPGCFHTIFFADVQNASPAFAGLLHLQDFLNHGGQFRTASGLEDLLVNQRAFLIIPIPFALDIGPGLYESLSLTPGHDGTHHNLGGVYRDADCPVSFEFWY